MMMTSKVTIDQQRLTLVRETDARTALTRGLSEFISALKTETPDGRRLKFSKVFKTWSEPEDSIRANGPDTLNYPIAIVYASGEGKYDTSKLAPSTTPVPGTQEVLFSATEYVITLMIEFWTTDPVARMWLTAMLEDELLGEDGRYGIRLTLPHYFGVHVDFEVLSSQYQDSEGDAVRRIRKAVFQVEGRVPVLKRQKYPQTVPARRVTVEGTSRVG